MKRKFSESENHRYSIEYVKKGWEGSIQEDAPSEEEAIAIAIDKGKIKSEKDVVKVTDLGVPGSYWKESAKGDELTEDAILDAIPVDARDGLIDIKEPDGSFGRYTWYVRFAPFSDEEAKIAADGIKEATGRRTQVAGFGREIYVLIMDYPSRVSESKKLVKEGAGAGYTVRIKDLKFGNIIDKKLIKGKERYDDYYECQVEILPGEYEIGAEDYYNDFFWEIHEYTDEEPTAKIDGGVATIAYSTNSYDEDEAEEELRQEVSGRTMDIAFGYGWGWVHADLPKDKIESDHVDVEGTEFYGSIDKIELNAPDLADAVNAGHQSIYDRDEDEEEDDGEEYDESIDSGSSEWRVFDYGEDFPYTERYTVLDYDGYQFFIAHNGGVGSFPEDAIDEIDSDEISDILEVEIDGKTYRPRELDSDEISSNRIVQKGLKLIKVKFQYEDE